MIVKFDPPLEQMNCYKVTFITFFGILVKSTVTDAPPPVSGSKLQQQLRSSSLSINTSITTDKKSTSSDDPDDAQPNNAQQGVAPVNIIDYNQYKPVNVQWEKNTCIDHLFELNKFEITTKFSIRNTLAKNISRKASIQATSNTILTNNCFSLFATPSLTLHWTPPIQVIANSPSSRPRFPLVPHLLWLDDKINSSLQHQAIIKTVHQKYLEYSSQL